MRKLYLGNGDKQFKFADTTTEIHLNAFDDGSAANLSADVKVRIKNDSGYLLGISASITDNHAVITSGQLAQLPVGSYLIELWDTVNGGTAIYPSDGFLALQISENVTGLSGGLVSSITVDDFIQQFSDLSQQLKQEVAVAVANGLKGDTGADGLSAYQIAVINGYKGSQTEWLVSLVGDKGDKGEQGESSAEVIDARTGYDGTAYDTLGTAIRTQVSKINYVEFKNYVGEDVFEEDKYWNVFDNKIVKATGGTNVASCPKIRIKANTRYSIRRLTNSFCYLGTDDDVLISKLSEYAGFTSFVYGDETCYSLITDTDCWLYVSYQTNRDYKTITVVEGKLPAKYYKYGVVFRKEINGMPIGGAWHEKIVVDKGGSGDYEDLNTAMKYVTDGDALHWTDIILKDDEHFITKEITIPDYCCIIGESGNRDKCIVNFVPTDTSDYAISTYSAFRMDKNAVLKNFTLKAINCRYCVHSDSSNTIKDWVQTLKNMKIEHLTNTSGSWESQNPWGEGASSGCLLTATDCIFIAHSAKALAFSVHNNLNFEKPFRHVFSKCEFYSENYGCFKCEGLISNTDDIVYCENCYFSAPIYLTNSLSIKLICSGCNVQQCNSTNYFAPNSVAEFREVTEKLKNDSGSKIEKGTLVAYNNDRSSVRPMTETDDASIYAGFTIGNTEPNEECTIITDGFYRYTDDLTFGTKYGISNGKPSKTADNKIGICVGGGFIHLTARY